MSTLAGIILARQVLQATGARYALSEATIRIIGAIGILSEGGGRASYSSVQQLLGFAHDMTVRDAASLLRKRGFLTTERGQGIIAGTSTSLRITATGQAVLSTLARVERELLASVAQVEVGTWKVKRKYVRDGQHVGEAAAYKKKRAEREAERAARRQDDQA